MDRGPSYEAFTGVHFRDRWTEENQNGNAEMPRLEAANNRNASTYNSFFLKKDKLSTSEKRPVGLYLLKGYQGQAENHKAEIVCFWLEPAYIQ